MSDAGQREVGRDLFRKTFFRAAARLSMAEAVVLVANVVQTILIARWLGPRLTGVAAVVLAYPSVVFAVFEPQSTQMAVRYLGEFTASGRPDSALSLARLSYSIDAALGALAFLVVAATAVVAEDHLVREDGTWLLLVLYSGACAFYGLTSTSRSVLITVGEVRTLAAARVAGTVTGVLLTLGLVLGGAGVAGVAWGGSMGLVLEGMALAVRARSVTHEWGGNWWSARWDPLRGRYREILRFVAYSDLEGIFNLVAQRLDIVLLGFLRGPTDVGFYRIARAIGSLPGHLIGTLEFTAYPRMATAQASEGASAVWAQSRRYAGMAGLPLALAVLAGIPFLPAVISLTTGTAYRPAVPAAQIMLGASAVWLAAFWLRPLLLTLGSIRFWTLNSGAFLVASVAGFLWLTPKHGFLAMAWVASTMLVLQHVVAFGYALRQRRRGTVHPRPPQSPGEVGQPLQESP